MSKKGPVWVNGLEKAVGYFNSEGELEHLCKELDIDYDSFGKANHPERVGGVVALSLFRNRLAELVKYCLTHRPRVQPMDYHKTNWFDIVSAADASIRIGDPMFNYVGKKRIKVPKPGEYLLWYHELALAIEKYYDHNEFRQLCEHLDYNYEYLSHLNREEQASEMVAYGIDTNQISKMIHYCKYTRPRVQPMWVHSIPWDDLDERAGAAIKTKNPLNDPILAKRVQEKQTEKIKKTLPEYPRVLNRD